jgi:hypothetical protein
LPCVYCRSSYLRFASKNAYETILRTRGGRYLIWKLHDAVNRKLAGQRNEVGSGPKGMDFATALRDRFRLDLTTKRFWCHFVTFVGYAMCDLETNRCAQFNAYFAAVCDFLHLCGCVTGTPSPRNDVLCRLRDAFRLCRAEHSILTAMQTTPDTGLEFDALWALHKRLFLAAGWTLKYCSVVTLQAHCHAGIVGCGPTEVKSL